MKTFVPKKEGVTIDGFYKELLNRTMEASGLPAELLGHDPSKYMRYEDTSQYDINNLEECVKLFEEAVKQKKKIYIYTDYDLDGIGSAVNMKLFCGSLGIKPTIYIPDRYEDGYGLTSKFVDRMIGEGKEDNREAILLTFDNGIAAIDEIANWMRIKYHSITTCYHTNCVAKNCLTRIGTWCNCSNHTKWTHFC